MNRNITFTPPYHSNPSSTLCLKVRLVPVSFEDPQFTASYQQSVALYSRYQMASHGDDPSECSESEVLHDYFSAPTTRNCTLCRCQLGELISLIFQLKVLTPPSTAVYSMVCHINAAHDCGI